MNNGNSNSVNEEETIEDIIRILLNDMIEKGLLIRKTHFATVNRERVRRHRNRKRQENISEYLRKVRKQKQRYRQIRR